MDSAYVLFRKRGYTRVNVDEISLAAGVTKRTLYSHFASKDELLEAVLETQHALAVAAFQTFGSKLNGTPEQVVRSYFRQLKEWSSKPRFSGSGFTRLAMELADLPGHPARRIASRHKRLLEEQLAASLAAAGHGNPQVFARQIWILTEGVMALTLIHGDNSYFGAAQVAALALTDRSLGH